MREIVFSLNVCLMIEHFVRYKHLLSIKIAMHIPVYHTFVFYSSKFIEVVFKTNYTCSLAYILKYKLNDICTHIIKTTTLENSR